MRVVCVGDSITAGQFLPEPARPWPDLLTGHEVIAKGVSNDTSRQILERFPRDVQELFPDTVVIQCGHNDCNHWATDRGVPRVSEAAYEANLSEMIDRCRAFDADTVLCSLTPSATTESYERWVDRYSALLVGVAGRRNVRVAHVRRAFQDRWSRGLLLGDGLHLSVRGHQLYAETVAECL